MFCNEFVRLRFKTKPHNNEASQLAAQNTTEILVVKSILQSWKLFATELKTLAQGCSCTELLPLLPSTLSLIRCALPPPLPTLMFRVPSPPLYGKSSLNKAQGRWDEGCMSFSLLRTFYCHNILTSEQDFTNAALPCRSVSLYAPTVQRLLEHAWVPWILLILPAHQNKGF